MAAVSSLVMTLGTEDSLIFVQIASYCDRDLANTVRSALLNASRPERLRFGICHQFDDATRGILDEWSGDSRFLIDAVVASESLGACWARARTQRLWQGEEFTMQVDAHMRFAQGWDSSYLRMLGMIESDRPLISNYPAAFRIESDGSEVRAPATRPYQLVAIVDDPKRRFRLRSEVAQHSDRPRRNPFIGACNFFTVGRFCADIPYDPDVYFIGEEISLSVRAYTHGYDTHYPNESVLWHWYHHSSRLHWSDHRDHGIRDETTRKRLRRLFEEDDRAFGQFGLGRRRTVADFEHLAGFSLAKYGEPRDV